MFLKQEFLGSPTTARLLRSVDRCCHSSPVCLSDRQTDRQIRYSRRTAVPKIVLVTRGWNDQSDATKWIGRMIAKFSFHWRFIKRRCPFFSHLCVQEESLIDWLRVHLALNSEWNTIVVVYFIVWQDWTNFRKQITEITDIQYHFLIVKSDKNSWSFQRL